jgi:Zn-dependent M16 (insulinase) family peptidase
MNASTSYGLLKERDIKELATVARLYRHRKSGAQVLSLINKDENKVFGITFRTPPWDSTGLPHILEHSVLCGSKKYPVKEPFVELLKSSLQTFLNAFTYPDKTCYPVASQSRQDFYNLIDVYLDAVFHPLLTSPIFQQEGWHHELDHPEKPLAYKGVVYNEMKGAYASPENLLARYTIQSLFPETPYAFDSGGDPKEIPSLSFEAFASFHRKYYHPSNARIYFYGDDDANHRLEILDAYLDAFESLETNSAIDLQAPFKKPVCAVKPYMVGEGIEAKHKSMVTVSWVLGETADARLNLALRTLEFILLGMPGSPLRKSLIDSGLGDDLAGEGLGTELRQIYFSTGLKGVDSENVNRLEPLILETLSKLSRNGIDRLTIEAAMNTIEFRLRENNTGRFPRGLLLMLRALTTWLYDQDPFALLAFEEPLKGLKTKVNEIPRYFEELLSARFVGNPHRATLVLEPDLGLMARLNGDEQERLQKARSKMSKDQVAVVVADTERLRALQEKADPPEALSKIPVLKVADLERQNKPIPISSEKRGDTKLLFHDLFTNGILYMDVAMDLGGLPAAYLPLVPLLGRAFTEMGTEKEDFVTLNQRISRETGGIWSETFASASRDQGAVVWLLLRSKGMSDRSHSLVDVLKDLLLSVKLENKERFRQILFEEKARYEERLIPEGHGIVGLRLKSHFGPAQWAAEQMGGIHYLQFIRGLAKDFDRLWKEVLGRLEDLLHRLINSSRMIFNLTLDEKAWHGVEPNVRSLMGMIPRHDHQPARWDWEIAPFHEAMIVPSQVNYVGKGLDLYSLGYQFHGSSLVVSRYVRNKFLWERVRVQGGAYGAFSSFDHHSGSMTLVSYRDPNLLKTLDVFDQVAHFLESIELTDEELDRSILGAIGDLDAYMLPDAKGRASMLRFLTGDTDPLRQRMREEMLSTRKEDFVSFGAALGDLKEKGIVKVLGGADAVQEAAAHKPGWLTVSTLL